MSWNLLERFLESDHFNHDPSLTVAYLSRYADHVGIHYVLCNKLRHFAYEEIEFFLPQYASARAHGPHNGLPARPS
ncbi:Phosphatidylinositol 4-kinase pik1alpha (PI4-kinase)(PtdIns-4-kinase) [Paraphaeosphaeria sporulosa]